MRPYPAKALTPHNNPKMIAIRQIPLRQGSEQLYSLP